ncbi:MAG: ethanolamine ammonia-lyase subunit EutC [Rhizobiales bacterium]|nr:ethanolamine ammonia-lyase subunit EutC [Hyphomicrobiales bacterium]
MRNDPPPNDTPAAPQPQPISGGTAPDVWANLRQLTAARIGLARSGASLATRPVLDMRLAHARARDAVHERLDEAKLLNDLGHLGLPVLTVSSAVHDRQHYLMRPDLGRQLAADGELILVSQRDGGHDVVFVVADGLSARAVQQHARPVLAEVIPTLRSESWQLAPLIIVRNGRVAIGDAIAARLGVGIVVALIGERPGLSSPDSMGAYLTWRPGPQTLDADRNCISNIRPEGVGYADAAFKLTHMLRAIRSHRMSGVRLKDDSDRPLLGER